MASASNAFQKQFPLDPSVLGTNSSLTLGIKATTDADVLQAIMNDTAFPTRPSGQLALGSIELQSSGSGISFNTGGNGTANFTFSAAFRTGVGVYDKSADAIQALKLDSAPNLDLTIPGDATSRYLLFQVGCNAKASGSGKSPIGLLGSVTFGADADAAKLFAVLHRIPAAHAGASTALAETISSWRLPRQVKSADDLKPGTWIVSQTDGSLALKIGAQLGYDFNFVRQANLLGMTRQLGAKVDAALGATFGFSVSGSYLVIIGRETDGAEVRLRLFKQSNQGFNLGLNLNVGVTGQNALPQSFDDLVKAVAGVHGQQVFNDLQVIKNWTDPTKDLGNTVARLANDTALKLLTQATGIDAAAEFNNARQKVLDAFSQWNALPTTASATLWNILDKADPNALAQFKSVLAALANPDPTTRANALATAITQAAVGTSPISQFLESIADQGLLALGNQLDTVSALAAKVQNILNGGVIQKIQNFINQHLDLAQIQSAIQANDFSKVDGWLVARLSDFLDKKVLDIPGLKEVQTALNAVLTKAPEIYKKALAALNNTYSMKFAAAYQSNTSNTALLDVAFDLNQPAAQALLQEVVDNSSLDQLFVQTVAGVTVNQAFMSHEIKRTADIQLHMPYIDSKTQSVNDSLASVYVDHDSGRVLAYQLTAKDTVTAENRYKSELSVLCKLNVAGGQVDPSGLAQASVAYQSLQVQAGMTLSELEARTQGFLVLQNLMPPDAAQRLYLGLDQTVTPGAAGKPSDNLGDVGLNLQVAMPATILAAWFQKRDAASAKFASMQMSRALQAKLKWLVPFYYLQNIDHLNPGPPLSALLVWSAIPPSTTIDMANGAVQQFNTDSDVYWEYQNKDLVTAVANDSHTLQALADAMPAFQDRLSNAGNQNAAAFFTAANAGQFVNGALQGIGYVDLQALLYVESKMALGAESALKDVQKAIGHLATSPSKAIVSLSQFGAQLNDTFNSRITSLYGDESLRSLNSMLLAEASAALSGAVGANPAAMLGLTVLKSGHSFDLKDYLKGQSPSTDQVAASQTLTNLVAPDARAAGA
jgi:hypothetical protein